MITIALDNLGEISHVIDDAGGAATATPHVVQKLAEFPSRCTASLIRRTGIWRLPVAADHVGIDLDVP